MNPRRRRRPVYHKRRNTRSSFLRKSPRRGSPGYGARGADIDKELLIKKGLIFGGGLLALIILLIVIINAGKAKSFIAEQGALSFSTSANGILVRSEKLYTADGYSKTEYIAQEGQILSSGSQIADIYSNDYSEKDYQALKELREKIMDYQQNNALTGIIDSDMETLNTKIAEKTNQIKKVISGEMEGNLDNLQRDISALMDERAALLRNASKEDSTLSSYYEQEATLVTKILNYKKTVLADKEGIVSFYFDGLESVLTTESMKNLTISNINSIYSGKFSFESSINTKPLYRLVDRNEWYVVITTEKEIDQFKDNSIFVVSFSFGNDYTYNGMICDHREEDGKHLYSVKFIDNIDKLLRARRVSITLSNRYIGIQVNKSVIKTVDGQMGVYYDKSGVKTFEPVTVLISEGDTYIIKAANPDSTLDVGSTIYY